MKLYTVPLAPNPTKVMLYLAEREANGDQFNIEHVMVNTLKGKHREPEHLARNPFGTLPVLELPDGRFIRESLAIIEYFEDKFPQGAMLSESPETRAYQRDIERIADVRVLIPSGNYVHMVNSPIGYPPNPERAAELKAQIQKPLDVLEAELSDGRDFLTGETVNLADFTLAAAFQFLRFINEDLIATREALRAWNERYRARDSIKEVLKW